jgi:hypothetical protein
MSNSRQKTLQERQRNFSQATQSSNVSVASTTVSEFLEEKVKAYQLELDYIKAYKDGLHEARSAEKLSNDEFDKELGMVFEDFRSVQADLKVLKRQRGVIQEDLEEEIDSSKRYRAEGNEPDISFLERAYTDTIVPRVMGASAKQKKSNFHHSGFREDALKYYNAVDKEGGNKIAYCHLTGWWNADMVKVAHLVPKSLSGEEVSYLFGVGEIVLSDPRNSKDLNHLILLLSPLPFISLDTKPLTGISLHKKIEGGLDKGYIVIIPVPDNEVKRTRWKCILVDESMRNATCFKSGGPKKHGEVKWGVSHIFKIIIYIFTGL